jgi:hypothetical protein
MKDFRCDADEKLLGEVIDGAFVALPPAPEGAALDDLLFAAVEMIENHPMDHGKLASDLKPIRDKHSTMLVYGRLLFQMLDNGTPDPALRSLYGGGVYAYIVEGSLRHVEELRPALIEYVNRKEELFRRGRLGDTGWEFTVRDLWTLGKQFGLAGPATPEEVEVAQKANESAWHKRQQEASEERARFAQVERESEITRRKKKVVERICALFFPFDGIDIDGETLSPEYLAMQQRRRQLRTSITNFVGFSVDEGEDDDEILKGVTMLKEIRFAGFGGDWLSAPLDPLDSGKRMFFTKPAEIVAYYGSDEAQKLLDADFKFCTQLMMDGRWSVSVVAKTEDDLARESEIDAEGERK